jgi:hypothetical protein
LASNPLWRASATASATGSMVLLIVQGLGGERRELRKKGR